MNFEMQMITFCYLSIGFANFVILNIKTCYLLNGVIIIFHSR